jgi:hypothetical protein
VKEDFSGLCPVIRVASLNSESFRTCQHYAYRILVGKPEGKRPLGRPRRRWVDNIKMDLRVIGSDGADWFDMAQDRDQWRALVNTVLNLRVPKNAGGGGS